MGGMICGDPPDHARHIQPEQDDARANGTDTECDRTDHEADAPPDQQRAPANGGIGMI